jgi:hypothetical protein
VVILGPAARRCAPQSLRIARGNWLAAAGTNHCRRARCAQAWESRVGNYGGQGSMELPGPAYRLPAVDQPHQLGVAARLPNSAADGTACYGRMAGGCERHCCRAANWQRTSGTRNAFAMKRVTTIRIFLVWTSWLACVLQKSISRLGMAADGLEHVGSGWPQKR